MKIPDSALNIQRILNSVLDGVRDSIVHAVNPPLTWSGGWRRDKHSHRRRWFFRSAENEVFLLTPWFLWWFGDRVPDWMFPEWRSSSGWLLAWDLDDEAPAGQVWWRKEVDRRVTRFENWI